MLFMKLKKLIWDPMAFSFHSPPTSSDKSPTYSLNPPTWSHWPPTLSWLPQPPTPNAYSNKTTHQANDSNQNLAWLEMRQLSLYLCASRLAQLRQATFKVALRSLTSSLRPGRSRGPRELGICRFWFLRCDGGAVAFGIGRGCRECLEFWDMAFESTIRTHLFCFPTINVACQATANLTCCLFPHWGPQEGRAAALDLGLKRRCCAAWFWKAGVHRPQILL